MRWLIILTLTILSVSSSSFATTIHVPADQSTIQGGLDVAEEGDTVMVAAGTYYETIIWPEVVGAKLIGAGEEDCMIDALQEGSVIRIYGYDLDPIPLIKGFTIRNGASPNGGGISCSSNILRLEDVTIYGNSASSTGGGMFLLASNLIAENVTIRDTSAPWGGGVWCRYGGYIGGIAFVGNTAEEGGGIWVWDSTSFVDVRISNCTATLYGGGLYCRQNSEPALERVSVFDNSAPLGGGIYCDQNTTLTFSETNGSSLY